MRNSNRRPNWWVLYAIAALFILVFILEAAIPLSETVRRSLEITVALLFYGLVWMWLGVNDQALMHEDRQRKSQRNLRLRKASAPVPAPLAESPVTAPQRVPGVLKTVLAWIISAALAIYGFFQS
jgi:energy-coupling factor transporter transmembrane protein EcfT